MSSQVTSAGIEPSTCWWSSTFGRARRRSSTSGETGATSGTAGPGSRAHVSTGPARAATEPAGFPPEPESGSIGAFRATRRDRIPPPAFAPWFAARCPEIPLAGARAVLELAREGATVPFITRYRKERTGNLDEVAVRRALEAKELLDKILSRQAIILESIERHGEAHPGAAGADPRDLRPRRARGPLPPLRKQKKNRALAAREAGLEPLADWIWNCGHGTETPQEGQTLELWAFTFRNEEKGVPDAKSAIEGARDILVERLAGTPELRALVRSAYFENGLAAGREEPRRRSPTASSRPTSRSRRRWRRSASRRARTATSRCGAARPRRSSRSRSGAPPTTRSSRRGSSLAFEAAACSVPDSPGAEVLRHAGRIAFKNNVRTSIENEVHRVLKDAADAAAAHVFAENVRRRLLEAPFGPKPVLGVDPGIRTGCKLAAVDASGRFVATDVVHLQTDEQKAAARETLARLAREHAPAAVAVGNGTGGREAEVFVRAALREAGLEVPVVLVSEAGASVYSASDAAREEFPDLDATVRGAISIARRLQDPLAELVKIEPRSIGVGQYQHDVAHAVLQRALDAVVEDCVNGVGVNLNTASRHLLAHVAGIGPALAGGDRGAPREAGPLPLAPAAPRRAPARGRRPSSRRRASCACPAASTRSTTPGCTPSATPPSRPSPPGSARVSRTSSAPGRRSCARRRLLEEELGAFTWEDVVAELEKPGRDPRETFVPFSFREDVQQDRGPEAGHGLPGHRHQRDELRRLRGHRRPPRRPRPRLAARREVREGAAGGR